MATIIKTNIVPHIFQGPWKGTYGISDITESELDAALLTKINNITESQLDAALQAKINNSTGDFLFGGQDSSFTMNPVPVAWTLTASELL